MPILIIVALACLLVGALIGNRLTWWWMNREWRRHPEQFKALVDGVVTLRKQRQGVQ
jgi:hypothetical protein